MRYDRTTKQTVLQRTGVLSLFLMHYFDTNCVYSPAHIQPLIRQLPHEDKRTLGKCSSIFRCVSFEYSRDFYWCDRATLCLCGTGRLTGLSTSISEYKTVVKL
jgi:hypothetical protein